MSSQRQAQDNLSLLSHPGLPQARFRLGRPQAQQIITRMIDLATQLDGKAEVHLGMGSTRHAQALLPIISACAGVNVHLYAVLETKLTKTQNLTIRGLRPTMPLANEWFVLVLTDEWRLFFGGLENTANSDLLCTITGRTEVIGHVAGQLRIPSPRKPQQSKLGDHLTAQTLLTLVQQIDNVKQVVPASDDLAVPLGLAWMLEQHADNRWMLGMQAIASFARADYARLYFLDDQTRIFEAVVSSDGKEENAPFKPGDILSDAAMMNDITADDEGGRIITALPVSVQDQVWGVVKVVHEQALTAMMINQLKIMVQLLGLAVERFGLVEQYALPGEIDYTFDVTTVNTGSESYADAEGMTQAATPDFEDDDWVEAEYAEYEEISEDGALYWPELDEFERANSRVVTDDRVDTFWDEVDSRQEVAPEPEPQNPPFTRPDNVPATIDDEFDLPSLESMDLQPAIFADTNADDESSDDIPAWMGVFGDDEPSASDVVGEGEDEKWGDLEPEPPQMDAPPVVEHVKEIDLNSDWALGGFEDEEPPLQDALPLSNAFSVEAKAEETPLEGLEDASLIDDRTVPEALEALDVIPPLEAVPPIADLPINDPFSASANEVASEPQATVDGLDDMAPLPQVPHFNIDEMDEMDEDAADFNPDAVPSKSEIPYSAFEASTDTLFDADEDEDDADDLWDDLLMRGEFDLSAFDLPDELADLFDDAPATPQRVYEPSRPLASLDRGPDGKGDPLREWQGQGVDELLADLVPDEFFADLDIQLPQLGVAEQDDVAVEDEAIEHHQDWQAPEMDTNAAYAAQDDVPFANFEKLKRYQFSDDDFEDDADSSMHVVGRDVVGRLNWEDLMEEEANAASDSSNGIDSSQVEPTPPEAQADYEPVDLPESGSTEADAAEATLTNDGESDELSDLLSELNIPVNWSDFYEMAGLDDMEQTLIDDAAEVDFVSPELPDFNDDFSLEDFKFPVEDEGLWDELQQLSDQIINAAIVDPEDMQFTYEDDDYDTEDYTDADYTDYTDHTDEEVVAVIEVKPLSGRDHPTTQDLEATIDEALQAEREIRYQLEQQLQEAQAARAEAERLVAERDEVQQDAADHEAVERQLAEIAQYLEEERQARRELQLQLEEAQAARAEAERLLAERADTEAIEKSLEAERLSRQEAEQQLAEERTARERAEQLLKEGAQTALAVVSAAPPTTLLSDMRMFVGRIRERINRVVPKSNTTTVQGRLAEQVVQETETTMDILDDVTLLEGYDPAKNTSVAISTLLNDALASKRHQYRNVQVQIIDDGQEAMVMGNHEVLSRGIDSYVQGALKLLNGEGSMHISLQTHEQQVQIEIGLRPVSVSQEKLNSLMRFFNQGVPIRSDLALAATVVAYHRGQLIGQVLEDEPVVILKIILPIKG